MPISAGLLTETVKLQKMTYTQNSIGEQVLSYEPLRPFCLYKAQVKFIKSGNAAILGQVLDTQSIMVTIRYHRSLSDINRLEWNGHTYDVDGVPNADRMNGTITMTCNLVIE